MLTNLYIHLTLIIIMIKKIYVHFGPPTIILNLSSFRVCLKVILGSVYNIFNTLKIKNFKC